MILLLEDKLLKHFLSLFLLLLQLFEHFFLLFTLFPLCVLLVDKRYVLGHLINIENFLFFFLSGGFLVLCSLFSLSGCEDLFTRYQWGVNFSGIVRLGDVAFF